MKTFVTFSVLSLVLSLAACSGMRKEKDKQMQQEKLEQQVDSSMQSGMEEDQMNTPIPTKPSSTSP